MLGCQPSTLTQRSMHHQKSSSDSPFHANTLKPRKDTGSIICSYTAVASKKWKIGDEKGAGNGLTSLCQGSSHLILGGVDVAGGPSALSPQSWQSLHQHLRRWNKEGERNPQSQTDYVVIYLGKGAKCVLFHSYSQQSGQWCGCSPLPWHQPGVFLPELVSSEPSGPASLEKKTYRTCKWLRGSAGRLNGGIPII